MRHYSTFRLWEKVEDLRFSSDAHKYDQIIGTVVNVLSRIVVRVARVFPCLLIHIIIMLDLSLTGKTLLFLHIYIIILRIPLCRSGKSFVMSNYFALRS